MTRIKIKIPDYNLIMLFVPTAINHHVGTVRINGYVATKNGNQPAFLQPLTIGSDKLILGVAIDGEHSGDIIFDKITLSTVNPV